MASEVNGELVPQGGGDVIPLVRTPLVLGRRESCDICLQFPNVSGKHCELSFKEGFWVLGDLGSTNGTKVNGLQVHRKVLHSGDTITIAKPSFKIQYNETGRQSTLDEFEDEMEEALGMGLLERAGLAHPPKHGRTDKADPKKGIRPVFDDDDDDDDDDD